MDDARGGRDTAAEDDGQEAGSASEAALTKPERPSPRAPASRRESLATTIASNRSGAETALGEPGPEGGAADEGEQDLLHPGLTFLHYELIRELGRGGMGRVFLARDTKLARKVAIKFLHRTSEAFNERFLEEARTTARCDHENIVVIFEVNEYRDQPFMVLEYLEGSPLKTLLSGGQKITPARAVQLMVPVLRALVRAHDFGIVHRDLKPDNIFVCDTGAIKVLDFGIAKLFEDKSPSESADRRQAPSQEPADATPDNWLKDKSGFVGTPIYMSPEQWGTDDIDHRTDIFAVGLMLYEMVAGAHPFADMSSMHLMSNAGLLDEPVPSVSSVDSTLPGDLERIIDRCLAKRKEERFQSAQLLLDALEPLLPSRMGRRLGKQESPYPGLTPFQEQHATRFFGRSREIARAAKLIQDRPLLAVAGPSGVGKSSFVRAGLAPALKEAGEDWEVLITRPGRQPLSGLVGLLRSLRTSTTRPSDTLEEQQDLAERLREEPGYLGSLLRERTAEKQSRILLFVDQFEELYTLVEDPEERLAYTACLFGAADDASSPLRVALAMRSDFLDRVAEDDAFLAAVTRGLLFLQAPDRAGLQEAIALPAEMAGFGFEAEQMVEQMLDALEETPGALPLLQFTASKLWERRDRKRKLITRASYNALGGIGGAFATHADEVLAALTPADQGLARAIFQRMVTPEGTRAIVDVQELQDLSEHRDRVQRVLDHLLEARLLVVQTRGAEEGPVVELVHESLISNWPLLRRWLDESHEHAAFLEQLRTAARQWSARGRPQGLLWRGEAMEEAQRFARRYKGALANQERRYLDAVFALASRAARRRRIVVAAGFSFLVLLLIVGLVVLIVVRRAEQAARDQARVARQEERRARKAEQRVKRQIELIKAEQLARELAQKEARRAKTEVKSKQKRLVTTEKKLETSKEQIIESLKRVKTEKLRAEQALRLARAAQAKSELATAEVKKLAKKERLAKEKYHRLWVEEQARRREADKLRRQIEQKLK